MQYWGSINLCPSRLCWRACSTFFAIGTACWLSACCFLPFCYYVENWTEKIEVSKGTTLLLESTREFSPQLAGEALPDLHPFQSLKRLCIWQLGKLGHLEQDLVKLLHAVVQVRHLGPFPVRCQHVFAVLVDSIGFLKVQTRQRVRSEV